MAEFRQQRLLVGGKFRQRFSRQPGLPVQFIAGEVHRRLLTADGLRRGMPESRHRRGLCDVDIFAVKQAQPDDQPALEADKRDKLGEGDDAAQAPSGAD